MDPGSRTRIKEKSGFKGFPPFGDVTGKNSGHPVLSS
jgi:hypothetical protein